MGFQMNRKSTLVLLICLFSSGCASVNVFIPQGRFQSSESNGKGFFISGGGRPGWNVELIHDASERPPDMNSPREYNALDTFFRGGFGVTEFLDLSIGAGLSHGITASLNGKLQVFGEPAKSAKKGNLSLSINGSVGYGSASRTGDQNGVFGPGGFDWTADGTVFYHDVAAMIGYRASDWFVIAAGPYMAYFDTTLKVDHKESDDASSPAATYSSNDTGTQKGIVLDLIAYLGASRRSSLMFEAGWNHSTFRLLENKDLNFGLIYNFSF